MAKYTYTAEFDDKIVRAYSVSTRSSLSYNLKLLSKEFGYPTRAIGRRAWDLGLTLTKCRRWSESDIAYLREYASSQSIELIARRLRRTVDAVKIVASKFGITLRVADGYSKKDLTQLFGTSFSIVSSWFDKRWLVPDYYNDRVTHAQVRRFVKQHPEEWSFRRVDELWMKDILFSNFGTSRAFKSELGECSENPRLEM